MTLDARLGGADDALGRPVVAARGDVIVDRRLPPLGMPAFLAVFDACHIGEP